LKKKVAHGYDERRPGNMAQQAVDSIASKKDIQPIQKVDAGVTVTAKRPQLLVQREPNSVLR
jgi:hypothetical protein